MPISDLVHGAYAKELPGGLEEFRRRGKAAWQDYLLTGISVPADDVLARMEAAFDAKRATLTTNSIAGSNGASDASDCI